MPFLNFTRLDSLDKFFQGKISVERVESSKMSTLLCTHECPDRTPKFTEHVYPDRTKPGLVFLLNDRKPKVISIFFLSQ